MLKIFWRRFKYYLKHPLILFEDIERYIAYRTYDKYHVVDSGLPPSIYDGGTLLLHTSFSILKDYVEIECAIYAAYYNKDKLSRLRKIDMYTPSFLSFLPQIFLPKFRSRELGLLYIEDQQRWADEDEYRTPEGKEEYKAAWREIRDLYLWWEEAQNRVDSEESTGVTAFWYKMRDKYGSTHQFIKEEGTTFFKMIFSGNEEEEKEYHRLLELSWAEDDRFAQEQEDMLVRLAKARLNLS